MAPHCMPESDEKAQDMVEEAFGVRPCLWQLKVVRAILEGKDVVTIAPTGAGKTLTYWMLLLFVTDGVLLMVVPLKQLGAQFEKDLMLKKLNAVNITAANTPCLSPETMVTNPHFEDLIKHRTFMRSVVNLVFDEAHVIKEWGTSFQIKAHLRMRNDTKVFRMSTDRANIFLRVKRMQHPANSFRDLADFVPKETGPDSPRPKKFLMFFNSRNQTQAAAEFLQIYALKVGDVNGECATEAVGMGIDLPDVYQIIQYGVPKRLSTLWQRFGRAVRDYQLHGTAILLAEPCHFDDEKEKAAAKQAEAEEEKRKSDEIKRKAVEEAIAAAQASGVTVSNSRKRKSDSSANYSRKRRKTTNKPEKAPEPEETDIFGRVIKTERAMDNFINAENRAVRCRRKVVLSHFGSINLQPIVDRSCCPRCAPKTVKFCCDICHPLHWVIPPLQDNFEKETATRMFNPPDYKRGEKEEKLRAELVAMRRRLWEVEVGPGHMIDPQSLWPTKLLMCMVDLAHYGKLHTLPGTTLVLLEQKSS
ncbi:P-loop containing nucleoside triphosphate hydrolase protein [Mucidula mucida]|nr:P-loop containing nucleoside triphosphate hydrolase protein [Mucidula mucida]